MDVVNSPERLQGSVAREISEDSLFRLHSLVDILVGDSAASTLLLLEGLLSRSRPKYPKYTPHCQHGAFNPLKVPRQRKTLPSTTLELVAS
jgi:hypothetical protein